MRMGDEGFHRGDAISSATAPNFKPPTPVQKPAAVRFAPTPSSRRLFMIEVFDQNSETKNIESAVIERGVRLGLQDFRSKCGTVREGKIIDDGGVIVGHWRYDPSVVAA